MILSSKEEHKNMNVICDISILAQENESISGTTLMASSGYASRKAEASSTAL